MPADFPEAYVLIGCIGVEYHYHTSWRAVLRWMRQYGVEELVQLRRGYLRMEAACNGSPNVCGRKPTIRGGGYDELPGGHPALAWMPVRRSRRPYRDEVWVHMRDGRQRPDLDDDTPHIRPEPESLLQWKAGRVAVPVGEMAA